MTIRQTIRISIGITVAAWWLGTFLLQILNIFPVNNFLLSISGWGLIVLTISLAIHDLIVFRSLAQFLDFFPDIIGSSPTAEEWTSEKAWRSLPKWTAALTVAAVIITISGVDSYTYAGMEDQITDHIKKDTILTKRIGPVKGFSFYRGGSSIRTNDTLHLDLTIRVYSEKGNFPLEVSSKVENETLIIHNIKILK